MQINGKQICTYSSMCHKRCSPLQSGANFCRCILIFSFRVEPAKGRSNYEHCTKNHQSKETSNCRFSGLRYYHRHLWLIWHLSPHTIEFNYCNHVYYLRSSRWFWFACGFMFHVFWRESLKQRIWILLFDTFV